MAAPSIFCFGYWACRAGGMAVELFGCGFVLLNRKMANYGYLCTAQMGELSPCVRSGRPEAFLKWKKETKKEILWVKKLC